METQYPPVALHHDHFAYSTSPTLYPLHTDQYLAPTGEVDYTQNFLGGSSSTYGIPHDAFYHRHSYRSAPTTAAPAPTATATSGLDATGALGFSGSAPLSTSSLFPGEELTSYVDPSWSWNQAQASSHGVVAPVPVLPTPPEVSFLPIKTKEAHCSSSIVRSPGPPLPTPAAMAVLLRSRSQSDGQSVYDGSACVGVNGAMGIHELAGVEGGVVPPVRGAQGAAPEATSREKKHACTMCHKRFDRPSTLRKHLLVHTGEKAFVCQICGRRFGVASNLNRHVKRCALKPVNMSHKSGSDSPSGGEETSPLASPVATSPENFSIPRSPPVTPKRGSISSSCSSNASSPPRGRSSTSPIHSPPVAATTTTTKPAKRKRRAPSPSRWVPLSLIPFNLMGSEDFHKSVQIPLPPVRRSLPREERDSWDENTSPTPYHPDGWTGVLPGPGFPPNQGLKAREAHKYNFGGGGMASAFTVGRVLVF